MPYRRLVAPRFCSSFGLRSWRALGIGVMIVMLSVAWGQKGASAYDDVLGVAMSVETKDEEPASEDVELKECWVFHHLLKAGGQTIKGVIHWWQKQVNIGDQIYVDHYEIGKWGAGAGKAEIIGSGSGHESYLLTGSYVEALHPYADRCKWFTVFRHPISRVVSAYYHCQVNPRDPLCATVVVSARTIDLHTFAELWSNFGLRQFALAYISQETVLSSDLAETCPGCPGWYLLKKHFEKTAQHSKHSEDIDGEMADLLKLVCEHLQNDYAAVGLLENFNATMHLFNRALELPGMDWPRVAARVGMKNTHASEVDLKEQERQALSTAWGDSSLYKFLELDMLLYGFATGIHKMQLAQYGL